MQRGGVGEVEQRFLSASHVAENPDGGKGAVLEKGRNDGTDHLLGCMVDRPGDGADRGLGAEPAWAGAINTVLVKKGVRVSELCSASRFAACMDVANGERGGE
jgi:hypothetical protein